MKLLEEKIFFLQELQKLFLDFIDMPTKKKQNKSLTDAFTLFAKKMEKIKNKQILLLKDLKKTLAKKSSR
jgi:hypothetical protein